MKTTVYSWRVTLERKAALEELARKQKRSVAELIDEAVKQWLESEAANDGDEAAQEEIRRSAARSIGSIAGGDSRRAEQASARVRQKLLRRRNESH
jgi:predicted transcriptional regulator